MCVRFCDFFFDICSLFRPYWRGSGVLSSWLVSAQHLQFMLICIFRNHSMSCCRVFFQVLLSHYLSCVWRSQYVPLTRTSDVQYVCLVRHARFPMVAQHPGEPHCCGFDCCLWLRLLVCRWARNLFCYVGSASDSNACSSPPPSVCAGCHVGADRVPSPEDPESNRVSLRAVTSKAAVLKVDDLSARPGMGSGSASPLIARAVSLPDTSELLALCASKIPHYIPGHDLPPLEAKPGALISTPTAETHC